MTQTRFRTVLYIVAHAFDLCRMVGTLCKTVRHQHIEHIGIGKAHPLLAFLLTGLQLVLYLCLAKIECHHARLGIAHVHVDEQVVGRIKAHQTVNSDTWIIRSNALHVADTLAIHHQLHSGILQSHVPVCRLNSVNHTFLGCTHCQYVCH